MKWYFENCRLSHVLLAGMIVWAVSAFFLLKEIAPVAYIGLHLVTTGIFFAAFLSVDRRSKKVKAPAPQEDVKKVA